MKLRRYSRIAGGIGALLVVSWLVTRYALQLESRNLTLAGGLGAGLLALYLWVDREEIEAATTSRGARFSAVSTLATLLMAGIAVAAYAISDRYDQRWDATSSGIHTLSEQSIRILEGLDEEVTVLGFFETDSPNSLEFRDLMEAYSAHTAHLTFDHVDPLRHPMVANANEIRSDWGTVVLRSGENEQRLESAFDEEALTNALVRLTAGVEHVVCFTTGHDELSLDDEFGETGLGALAMKLRGQNYRVESFLPLRDQVPTECEVVVVADPRRDFTVPEIELLVRTVASGGAVIVLLEPFGSPALASALARFGIRVGRDQVLEVNPSYRLQGGDESDIILDAAAYEPHPITDALDGLVVLRGASSVALTEGRVEGVDVQMLARTSEQAWGETDLTSGRAPSPDPPDDLVGRVPVISLAEVVDPAHIAVGSTILPPRAGTSGLEASLENVATPATETETTSQGAQADSPKDDWRNPGGRLLVFGDGGFVSNQQIETGNNQDLFLNSVAWLVDEEDQIAIRPSSDGEDTLTVTMMQGAIVWLLSLLVAPGLAGLGAVWTWSRRRRL